VARQQTSSSSSSGGGGGGSSTDLSQRIACLHAMAGDVVVYQLTREQTTAAATADALASVQTHPYM
jgi:hypothetical protein